MSVIDAAKEKELIKRAKFSKLASLAASKNGLWINPGRMSPETKKALGQLHADGFVAHPSEDLEVWVITDTGRDHLQDLSQAFLEESYRDAEYQPAPASPPGKEYALTVFVRNLNIDELSPMEALTKLYELKRMMK
jgi:hypothetical protein